MFYYAVHVLSAIAMLSAIVRFLLPPLRSDGEGQVREEAKEKRKGKG